MAKAQTQFVCQQINLERFVKVLGRTASRKILVIGGSTLGLGMKILLDIPAYELIETDVSFGSYTKLICDAHDIPFEKESFDAVILQAVLEHVVDPCRCIEEVHRVLKTGGVVYAETPFMQQVHMGCYDFTRFTHLGHRRLFRKFTELDSGAVCGPGMALAWSFQYFLLCFARTRLLRACLRAIARNASFFLKYFDSYLADRPGAFDAASGFYFIGRKSDMLLSDRELIRGYKGLSWY